MVQEKTSYFVCDRSLITGDKCSFLCGFSRLAVLFEFIMGFKKKKKNCNRDLLMELPKGEIIRILIGKSLVISKRVFERLKPTSSLSSEFLKLYNQFWDRMRP